MKKIAMIGVLSALASSAGMAATVFQEDFESAVVGFYNVGPITGTGFNVVNGTADINGVGSYGFLCVSPASGQCLDTQGSGSTRGAIETGSLNLANVGTYTLSFTLVRWDEPNGAGAQNSTVRVTLGSLFDQTYTVDNTWTNQTVVAAVNVAAPTSAVLRFSDQGGSAGFAGAILDNVSLESPVPEPGTIGLLGLGCCAVAFMRRKRS